MRFNVASDNRNGSVTVKAGSRGDARDDNYNVDPSKRYAKITRTLSESDGAGAGRITSTLETSSEFVDFTKDNYECAALTFTSKGTITLPQDAAANALGVVHDSISMGFRVARACKVQLTASVLSDLDIAEIRVQGPSFDKRVFDDFDDTLDLTNPGEYILKGAYHLSLRLPNPSLGGRPISVELQATLKPAS